SESMSNDFLGIPQNAIEMIFSYLDDKSLLRLREVCKSANDSVNDCLLNFQEIQISCYSYAQKRENTISVSFNLSRYERPIYEYWKIGLKNIVHKLGITGFKFSDKENVRDVTAKIENGKVKSFLEYLKPRI
ncbi:hypothetical protein PENTCL1PPCAC_815, partial [Pristionchus entomophagus]